MKPLNYKTHPHKDYPYWLHDPRWEGTMYFQTAEDRDIAAEDAINAYLDDGWDEEVEFVSCGVVTHFAQCLEKIPRPVDEDLDEDGYDGEGIHWPEEIAWRGNYKMEPIKKENE